MDQPKLPHPAVIPQFSHELRQIAEPSILNEAIVSSLKEGLVISDMEGTVLHMNPAALQLYGFSHLAEAQRHRVDFVELLEIRDMEGTLLPTDEWPLACLLRDGHLSKYLVRVRHKGTGIEWIGSYNGAEIRDASHGVIGAVLTIRDVTKEVVGNEQEAALLSKLTAERALLDALIECAPVGIVLTDSEAKILRSNRTADALIVRPLPLGESYESHGALSLLREDGYPFSPRELPLTRAALEGVETKNAEMAIG